LPKAFSEGDFLSFTSVSTLPCAQSLMRVLAAVLGWLLMVQYVAAARPERLQLENDLDSFTSLAAEVMMESQAMQEVSGDGDDDDSSKPPSKDKDASSDQGSTQASEDNSGDADDSGDGDATTTPEDSNGDGDTKTEDTGNGDADDSGDGDATTTPEVNNGDGDAQDTHPSVTWHPSISRSS